MSPRLAVALATVAVVGSMAGCQGPVAAPASGVPTMATVSPSPAMGTATPAPSPVPSALAGFEGWSMIKPFAVESTVEDGTLVLTLIHQALWFNASRGVLFSKPVSGDFRITATVRASKTSDPSAVPGGDGRIQLGGLMAHADRTPQDYVFIVVGDDGDGPSIETKSTDDSVSTYEGPSWPSAAADLRLCRMGASFTLYKRAAGSSDAWELAKTYVRPDLPDTLQVGANIYSASAPDLTIRYENLRVEHVSTAEDCTA